jgi:hypothetical protein
MFIRTLPKPAVHPRRATVPSSSITGNAITKGRRNKYERARLAARWHRGDLEIIPTTAMAARTFDTTEYLVKVALTFTPPASTASVIDRVWARLTPQERDAFVNNHINDLWIRFERVTEAA